MKDLIVGQWYSFRGHYGKFKKFSGTYCYFYPWIINQRISSVNLGCFSSEELVDLKEISEEVVRKWEKPFENQLITEAKKRYPVGTKFFPAHLPLNDKDGGFCVITEDTVLTQVEGNIIAKVGTKNWIPGDKSDYGNCDYNRNVYYNGNWAEIITEKTDDLKIGDYVTKVPGPITTIPEDSFKVSGYQVCFQETNNLLAELTDYKSKIYNTPSFVTKTQSISTELVENKKLLIF